jgi:membrane-associated protease RseP (regulator of RpoE activity)
MSEITSMSHNDSHSNEPHSVPRWSETTFTLTVTQTLADGSSPTVPSAPENDTAGYKRNLRLPIILFLLTCVSTFVAGATGWMPHEVLFTNDPLPLRRAILLHWADGLTYMTCLLGMLMAHEMGHFLATVYYKIPASFPYFLPLPITPIGTLGAVIRMDNRDADRKQMFDIGIAGPLAGLVLVIPLLIGGMLTMQLQPDSPGRLLFDLPMGARWVLASLRPELADKTYIGINEMNPFLMAGWVGLLVTALNLMPVGQLDGGHITYTLFGRRAHWIARGFMLCGVIYMAYFQAYQMSLMVLLIFLTGVDHPPTSNDRVSIGWFRFLLGLVTLIIPLLCLTVQPIFETQ